MTSVLSFTLVMTQQNRKILGQMCVLTFSASVKTADRILVIDMNTRQRELEETI